MTESETPEARIGELLFRDDGSQPLDLEGRQVDFEIRRLNDGGEKVFIGGRAYRVVVADIGGATLLPALDYVRQVGTAAVIIDPRATVVTPRVLQMLRDGHWREIAAYLDQSGYYDNLPPQQIGNLETLYRDMAEENDGLENIYCVPTRLAEVELRGFDLATCLFPHPANMPPLEIVNGGARLLKPGGVLEIVTESRDWWQELLRILDEKDFKDRQLETISPDGRGRTVPRTLYDFINAGKPKYRARLTMPGLEGGISGK
jgi:hypothetical protein